MFFKRYRDSKKRLMRKQAHYERRLKEQQQAEPRNGVPPSPKPDGWSTAPATAQMSLARSIHSILADTSDLAPIEIFVDESTTNSSKYSSSRYSSATPAVLSDNFHAFSPIHESERIASCKRAARSGAAEEQAPAPACQTPGDAEYYGVV